MLNKFLVSGKIVEGSALDVTALDSPENKGFVSGLCLPDCSTDLSGLQRLFHHG